MSIKKIGVVSGIILAEVFLSGCGGNKTVTPNPAPSSTDTAADEAGSAISSENLPAPTGKVDDTVNAIIDGAGRESDQAKSDEADAKTAADSNQGADDLGTLSNANGN